jgi:hypothetical protein
MLCTIDRTSLVRCLLHVLHLMNVHWNDNNSNCFFAWLLFAFCSLSPSCQ